MITFNKKGNISFEVLSDFSDFVPNRAIDIDDCMRKNLAPPETSNLEYDSDENGENVSFDDASPIIPDKIAALERLNELESQYKYAKDKAAADALASEAQKMASASDTIVTTDTKPSE